MCVCVCVCVCVCFDMYLGCLHMQKIIFTLLLFQEYLYQNGGSGM